MAMLCATHWMKRIAIAAVVVVTLVALAQGGYFFESIRSASAIERTSASWNAVSHDGPTSGQSTNTPDVTGAASASWDGPQVTMRLLSTGPASQQFFAYDAGPPTTSFFAQALVRRSAGAQNGACVLLFGFSDSNHYYAFRVQDAKDGYGGVARLVRVDGEPSGHYVETIEDESRSLPYVNRFSLPRTWELAETKLSIHAVGQDYVFFVNDRVVFQRTLPEVPNHRFTVGVIDPGTPGAHGDIVCEFSHVSVRETPG